jgi:hypothetical protein
VETDRTLDTMMEGDVLASVSVLSTNGALGLASRYGKGERRVSTLHLASRTDAPPHRGGAGPAAQSSLVSFFRSHWFGVFPCHLVRGCKRGGPKVDGFGHRPKDDSTTHPWLAKGTGRHTSFARGVGGRENQERGATAPFA